MFSRVREAVRAMEEGRRQGGVEEAGRSGGGRVSKARAKDWRRRREKVINFHAHSSKQLIQKAHQTVTMVLEQSSTSN